MTDEIKDVLFHDGGPHVLPLLVEHQATLLPDRLQEYAVLRFLCEGGPELDVPISAQILPSLISALKIWQLKIAERESSQSQKH
jgi:hypothetical protein